MVLVQSKDYKSGERGSPAPDHVVHITGLGAVICASITSGFAGVYLEHMLKNEARDLDLFEQNIQLGIFSLPSAMVAILFNHSWISNMSNIFFGFDGIIFAVFILQAVGGLIVAAVVKFASSILKCYAISVSICVVSLLSHSFGYEKLYPSNFLGLCLTIASIVAFTKSSERRNVAQAPQQNSCSREVNTGVASSVVPCGCNNKKSARSKPI